MKKSLLTGLMAAGILFVSNVLALEKHPPVPAYPGYNRLMIPKTNKTININADLAPEKWSGAAEITGFLRYNYHRATEILPEEQRIHFYLMYNDEYLYIGMHSRNFPEGAPLKTDQKNTRDQGSIVLYDHFEIQFSRNDNPGVALKKHFYKYIGNHRNSLFDQKAQPSVGQLGLEWNGDAKYATRFTDKYWDMEIAIPFKTMDEEVAPEDFETWIMWLVRAYNSQSSDFFMWGGKDWMCWDYMPRFSFHSNLAAARMKKIGEPLAGKLDMEMELTNHSNEKQKVYFNLNIKEKDKEVFNYDKTCEMDGNGTGNIELKKDDIPNNKNTVVTITAWMDGKIAGRRLRKGKGKLKPIVLYQQQFTLVRKDKEYQRNNFEHVKKYRESQIAYKWQAAYIHSDNAVSGELNMDFDGIDPKYLKAETWRLKMEKDGQTGFSQTAPVRNSKAKISSALPKRLSDGKWKMVSELIGKDGKVIDRQSYSFNIEKQPWEDYKGGIDDNFVPPPYKAIKVIGGNKLQVLNSSYVIDKCGLPSSIVCEGKELLVKPMTFKAQIDGGTFNAVGEGFKITDRKGGKISWEARARLGSIILKLNYSLEYDGALFIDFEMLPEKGGVKVDKLDFVVEFAGFVNAIKVFRGSDYSGSGGIIIKPEQKGVIWESVKSRSVKNLIGSFNPAVFIGTPNKGLWWFGKSDRGWILDDNKSATVIERNQKGNIVLKQCLINKPASLDKPRKISFMTQAVPAKPLPANWREISWGPCRIYGGAGWSNGFYGLTYEKKENWEKYKKWEFGNMPPYVATELIGRITPGFSTYCGEWTGDSNDKRFGLNPRLTKSHPKFYVNSVGIKFTDKWEERVSNYVEVDTVPSLANCRVWCYEQGVKNAGIRGYWWDMNTYRCVYRPEAGLGYTRDDGREQGEFNYFIMRDMFKRMYQLAYMNGTFSENWHYTGGVLGAFQYGSWLTEGYYYMFSPSVNLIEGSPRDFWPIAAGKFTGAIPQMRSNFHDVGLGHGFVDAAPTRAALTLCLLNDFGAYGMNKKYRDSILAKLRDEGFLDPKTGVVLHWQPKLNANASFSPANKDADVLITVYTLPGDKLLAVLGNMSKVGSEGCLRLNVKAFLKDLKKIHGYFRDLETGIKTRFDRSKSLEIKTIYVGGHDFRLFIIE